MVETPTPRIKCNHGKTNEFDCLTCAHALIGPPTESRKQTPIERAILRTYQIKGWLILAIIVGSYIVGFYFGRGA